MSSPVFIDSNVPMYLIGSDHPLKFRAQSLLRELIISRRRLVTSAEVMQEICHRYCAIRRVDSIQKAFDALYGIVDDIIAVTRDDIEKSKGILLEYPGVAARDSLHAGMIRNLGITELFSFDSDFDIFPWIARIM